MALYTGLDRVYGIYRLSGTVSAKGKREGKGETVAARVTPELYEKHLNKEQMLGVVPVMDDGKCWFAALDVDDYTGKYVSLVDRVREMNLPFIPVISKSGGVHLYLLFSEPAPCDIVREKLKELADALGIPGVEIFPKQDALQSVDEFGSWLNLPYFGGALGPQHAERLMVDPRTQEQVADLGRFLDIVERRRITVSQLQCLCVEAKKRVQAPFRDGPPCLQRLALSKVGEGGRNNVMFQFGIYFRQKHSRDAGYSDAKLVEYMQWANKEYFDPPLDNGELMQTAKSVHRDKYFYKCGDQPMLSVCNRAVCLTRKYGIGAPDSDTELRVEYGTLVKFQVCDEDGKPSYDDPPWYQWTIDGKVLRIAEDVLTNIEAFRNYVFTRLNVYPPAMKPENWKNFLTVMAKQGEYVDVPFESGPKGQLVGHIRDFIRDYGTRYDWAALLEGGVFIDRNDMFAYFKWQDLNTYLNRKNVKGFKQNDIFALMRTYLEGTSGDRSVHGKHLRWWRVKIRDMDLPPPEETLVTF